MKDEDCEDRAQEQLASLKRDMRKTMEDATVRAMHKVMAEFEAKSDERLIEDWGPGPHEHHSLPKLAEQPAKYDCCANCMRPQHEHNMDSCPKPYTTVWHAWDYDFSPYPAPAVKPAQTQQEPVAQQAAGYVAVCEVLEQVGIGALSRAPSKLQIEEMCNAVRTLYTSPPARKPLTHEQRVDLLTKFEPHKHEWHAPAILIDMVEAAHGITGGK